MVCRQAYAVQTDHVGFDETPGRARERRQQQQQEAGERQGSLDLAPSVHAKVCQL